MSNKTIDISLFRSKLSWFNLRGVWKKSGYSSVHGYVYCQDKAKMRTLFSTCCRREADCSPNQGILITGCDSETGIGVQVAKYLHETTNFTLICGFRRAPNSEGYKILNVLSEATGRLIPVDLDITSNEQIDKLVNFIKQLKKDALNVQLFAVINNAGVLSVGEFVWQTPKHIEDQFKVNVLGTVMLTRAVLPFIIESKGRIINVSSIGDGLVFPYISVYSSTKNAVWKLSQTLAYELKKFGVKLITIRPGPYVTNMGLNVIQSLDEMSESMNENEKQLHGSEMGRFKESVAKIRQDPSGSVPELYPMSNLCADFRRALLDPSPPTVITSLPLRYRLLLNIVESLPVKFQYYLIDLLMPSASKR